jgi:hypothetical protein
MKDNYVQDNEISRTIKKILKDKIKEGKVTEKWIEECLAPEYKRQYTKSEPISLSKQQPKQQIIEVSTEGKQVSPEQENDDTSSNHLVCKPVTPIEFLLEVCLQALR